MQTTRLSLHAVAELLLAGPQHVVSGTIRLRVTPGGFGTVAEPSVRVEGTSLVVGGWAVPLDGRTIAEVGAGAGVVPHSLDDVYSGGWGLTAEHPLRLDPAAAAEIAEGFRAGAEAMTAFAPDLDRVLWPEHFDLGITRDEVNYGVSPGDDFLGVPYAYVGPWRPDQHTGPFWNAPFGAAHPLSEIPDLAAFFAEGAALAAQG
ncbi:hypothetical protein FB382_000824 [Nocardioides ginsengisegetis]|uniref:Uncharacterized protein n=1 Tax=Nocardioides ginsengisegetis TaxID=661491 RepID=A0A7W3IXP0_9ACTN|nr:hypothetical protein [Nocardioides ginsengisegetis]MBA8802533.1 hypothetical protein [Nocardioides ginsengisegetis]